MLKMLMDNFKADIDGKIEYEFETVQNKKIKECTGFIIACILDNTNIVNYLTK